MTKEDRDKKETTITEHLTELRKRLVISLIFFLAAFAISLVWSSSIYRFLTSQFNQKLLVLGPNDILMIYLRLASVSGLALSLPFMAYQLWAYLKPALKPKESALLLIYVPAVFICFVSGLIFGFLMISPAILQVLLALGEELFETQLTAQNYISFVLNTTLPIGLFFEFPVVIAFLTSAGILQAQTLKTYRRYAYFTLIIAAVVLTPADLISDLALSAPLILIYEVSVIISQIIENRRKPQHGNS